MSIKALALTLLAGALWASSCRADEIGLLAGSGLVIRADWQDPLWFHRGSVTIVASIISAAVPIAPIIAGPVTNSIFARTHPSDVVISATAIALGTTRCAAAPNHAI